MSIMATIEDALFARVQDALGAYPLAWPNIAFDPKGGDYIEVANLPAANTRRTIAPAGEHWRTGLLQLSVRLKREAGETTIREIADIIEVAFAAGKFASLPKLEILATPVIGPNIIETNYSLTPITISWGYYG